MKRIRKFGVLQTAKVSAIIYFIVMLVFMIPFGLFSSAFLDGADSFFPFGGGIMFFLLPFVYGLMVFIFTALGCLVYNLIAGFTGGIEVELETVEMREEL